MGLTDQQSGPGNRVRTNNGDEADVVARVGTDQGSYVILNRADDGSFLGVVSEGVLRDDEDVEHVSTTGEARQREYEAEQEKQRAEDERARQERQQARADAEKAREDAAAAAAENPTTDTTGATDPQSGPQPPTPQP